MVQILFLVSNVKSVLGAMELWHVIDACLEWIMEIILNMTSMIEFVENHFVSFVQMIEDLKKGYGDVQSTWIKFNKHNQIWINTN